MEVTEDMVLEQLRKVIDPELFVNIVDLGLIYTIELADASDASDAAEAADTPEATDAKDVAGAAEAPQEEPAVATEAAEATAEAASPDDAVDGILVKIDMTMTSPMCPAGPQLVGNSKQVVGQIDGVGKVEVRVVMDPPWTPDKMTDDAKDQLGIF